MSDFPTDTDHAAKAQCTVTITVNFEIRSETPESCQRIAEAEAAWITKAVNEVLHKRNNSGTASVEITLK